MNVFRAAASALLVVAAVLGAPATGLAGLVSRWPFDEGQGLAADDAQGSNDGALQGGASWTFDGLQAAAVVLDGIDDRVRVEDAATLDFGTDPFSVVLWAKGSYASGASLISKGAGFDANDSAGFGITYAGAPERLYLLVGNGTSHIEHDTGIRDIPDWTQIGLTRDALGRIFYIRDGVLTDTGKTLAGDVSNAVPLTFGANDIYSTRFNGSIDEARVFDHALSAAEVAALYESDRTRFTAVASYALSAFGNAHQVALVGGEAYVVILGTTTGRRISVATGASAGTFTLPFMPDEYGLAYDPGSGRLLHISDDDGPGEGTNVDRYFETSLSDATILSGPHDLFAAGDDLEDPHGLAFDPATGRRWTTVSATQGGTRGLFRISDAGANLGEVPGAAAALSVAFNPATGKLYYVENGNSGAVKEIPTSGGTPTTVLDVGSYVSGLAFGPTGDILVLSSGAGGTNTLYVFDGDLDSDAVFTTTASGGTILKATYSPAEISATATFTTAGTLAGDGSYLEFTQEASGRRLFHLPLLAAGTLSDSAVYTVAVVVSADAVTADNDLAVAVSDGTDMVGCHRIDLANGIVGFIFEAADATPVSYNTLRNGPTSTTTAARYTVVVTLDAATSGSAFMSDNPTSFGTAASRVVNRTAALRLTVFGDDAGETYRIRQIDVTIRDRMTRLWVGGGGTSWATWARWNPAGVPSAVDDIRLEPGSGASVIDGAYSVRSLTLPSGFTNLVSVSAPLTVRQDVVVTSGTLAVGAGSLSVAGGVTVNGGTLKGSIAGSGTAVTLTAGGTLKGNATVGRAVIVGPGGRISPGE